MIDHFTPHRYPSSIERHEVALELRNSDALTREGVRVKYKDDNVIFISDDAFNALRRLDFFSPARLVTKDLIARMVGRKVRNLIEHGGEAFLDTLAEDLIDESEPLKKYRQAIIDCGQAFESWKSIGDVMYMRVMLLHAAATAHSNVVAEFAAHLSQSTRPKVKTLVPMMFAYATNYRPEGASLPFSWQVNLSGVSVTLED